jgi:hypothetical protein
MSLKIKGRCGKLGGKAGISMKTQHLALRSGNVVEKKAFICWLVRRTGASGGH